MCSTIQNRNRTADLLKGLAVIFMIQVHLMELFATPEINSSWIGKISLFLGGPPAAPIFMVVMGYYFALSKRTLFSSLFRGLKLIVLGFLLNLGLNLNLFFKIAGGTYQTSPWPYVFGVDILFLAGLSLVFLSIMKYFFKLNLIPYLILIALVFIIQLVEFPPGTNESLQYFQAYFVGNGIWWSYFPIIPWLAYPAAGFALYIILPKISIPLDALQRYLLIITGIITFIFIGYGIEISANLTEYYNHGWLFFLFTCCLLIFYAIITNIISKQKETKLSRWVEWLGINVTAAYVIQWLFTGNIATEVYKTQSILQLIFWFFAALAVTSIGIFLWNKIKI